MPITITLDRPVLTATNSIMEDIEVGTAVASGTDIDFKVYLDGLTIPTITTAVGPTWSTASAIITGTGSDFANVKAGDVVSSAVDFNGANERIVDSVDVGADTVTLTANPAADATSGTEALVFTAGSTGDLDSTLYHVKLTHSVSGSILTVVPKIACQDGSLVFEGSTADNSDDALFANGTAKTLPAVTINLDDFLTNARVPRT